MITHDELRTPCPITWCPGCGNFAIWAAFKNACVSNGWDNSNSVLVAGIGCHGHIVNFMKLTSFEGLHGRALPLATGIKLVNDRLHVFAVVGDGDCLGEGGNHFIHAARRNHDITVLLHDNALYALTTGQTSPTSPQGYKSKSTPAGNPDEPFSPISLAIASGATFVARAYAGDIAQTASIIAQAEAHKGFSLVDILQPCVTFNKLYTSVFYQTNKYYLDESYDPTDKAGAFMKAQEWGSKQIPLGVFYRNDKPSYETYIPQIAQKPLVDTLINRSMMESIFTSLFVKGILMNDQTTQDKTVIVGKYKVTVIRDLCIGAASCVAISPSVFQLDGDDKAIIPADAMDSPESIVMAAQSCPTKAIIIEDIETGERVWPQ